MANTVFYFQVCPVCGRSLRIRVALLGRRVFCGHCDGGFVATHASLDARPRSGPVLRPLEPAHVSADRPSDERVEELLERATAVLGRQAAD